MIVYLPQYFNKESSKVSALLGAGRYTLGRFFTIFCGVTNEAYNNTREFYKVTTLREEHGNDFYSQLLIILERRYQESSSTRTNVSGLVDYTIYNNKARNVEYASFLYGFIIEFEKDSGLKGLSVAMAKMLHDDGVVIKAEQINVRSACIYYTMTDEHGGLINPGATPYSPACLLNADGETHTVKQTNMLLTKRYSQEIADYAMNRYSPRPGSGGKA